MNKITPGNALTQPSLISKPSMQMQNSELSQEYGAPVPAAMRQPLSVERNEQAIAASQDAHHGQRQLSAAGRLTDDALFPTRSPFVPTGEWPSDAHRQAA